MFSKILVALDQGTTSQYIFEQSVFLAKTTGATMMLFHVLSPLEDGSLCNIYATSYTENANKYIQAWEQEMQQRLNWLRSLRLEAMNAGVKTEFIQNTGGAGRLICQTALDCGADLIIVGRRGRTGVSEFVLGSVSNYLLHHFPCSILTIQGNDC